MAMMWTSRNTYLTQEAALSSMLHRMETTPDYRPAGFAPGNQGVDQAAEYLADLREAMRELNTEGDS